MSFQDYAINSRQKSMLDFIEKYFAEADYRERGSGTEFRAICPFCEGGRTREASFDMNITNEHVKCWRSSCLYKGNFAWFMSEFLKISYREANNMLRGPAYTSEDVLLADLEYLKKNVLDVELFDDKYLYSFDIGIKDSKEISELRNEGLSSEIKDWILNRRYDIDWFIENHPFLVPPQIGKGKCRVQFEVETEGSRAYQLYSFIQGVEPKTINPDQQYLSYMLYNYNNVIRSSIVFVTEGIFSCARLNSWGYSAVALFGVILKPYQNYLLSRLDCDEICVCLDHGTKDASLKIYEQLKDGCYGKKLSILEIDVDGADPDDLEEVDFVRCFKKRKKKLNSREGELERMMKDLKKLGYE